MDGLERGIRVEGVPIADGSHPERVALLGSGVRSRRDFGVGHPSPRRPRGGLGLLFAGGAIESFRFLGHFLEFAAVEGSLTHRVVADFSTASIHEPLL